MASTGSSPRRHRKLLRQRVEQVVLPAGASAEALPEGLRPVETLPLRRAIAADWCGELLRFRGENPAGARVLITADALSGEVVRTVTELALRHRYLILKVPFGGEELCRRLRREYGVSIVLNPETEREPVGAAGFLPGAAPPAEPPLRLRQAAPPVPPSAAAAFFRRYGASAAPLRGSYAGPEPSGRRETGYAAR